MGKLFLVVTPIGNLEDISLRAISILKDVNYIACENPQNSRKLLSRFDINNKKLIQLNSVHEESMSNNVINILKNENVAYISDAGFPCISDPGSILVKKCREFDIDVSVIGGNSACLNALIGSSINCNRFFFFGFLSSKEGTLKNELISLKNYSETLIFYESSHRINQTIKIMKQVFLNRKICIAKELTKIHETYIIDELSDDFELTEEQSLGEFVIVVEGNSNNEIDYQPLINDVSELISLGVKTKSAVDFVAKKNNVSKNVLYNLIHTKKEN